METKEPILLRLNRLCFFKSAVAKKKKRKSMLAQNVNWKRNVVLAYNVRGINEVGFLPNLKNRKRKNQFAFIPLLYEVFFREGKKEI